MYTSLHRLALVTRDGRGLCPNTALALAKTGVDVVITHPEQEASARALAREVEQFGRKAAVIQKDTAEV